MKEKRLNFYHLTIRFFVTPAAVTGFQLVQAPQTEGVQTWKNFRFDKQSSTHRTLKLPFITNEITNTPGSWTRRNRFLWSMRCRLGPVMTDLRLDRLPFWPHFLTLPSSGETSKDVRHSVYFHHILQKKQVKVARKTVIMCSNFNCETISSSFEFLEIELLIEGWLEFINTQKNPKKRMRFAPHLKRLEWIWTSAARNLVSGLNTVYSLRANPERSNLTSLRGGLKINRSWEKEAQWKDVFA